MKKILFISFDHIGDILRFTPIMRTLRQEYPSAYISVLVPDTQAGILVGNPMIDDIIPFPHGAVRKMVKEGAVLSEVVDRYGFQLITMLRRMEFDLVINPFMEFGAIIAGLINPPQVLGRVMTQWGEYQVRGEEAARFYYTMAEHNDVRVHSEKRFSDSALDILKDVGIQEERFVRAPEFYPSERDEQFADAFLEEEGISESDIIVGLQMGAMLKKERFWPIEKFAEAVNFLYNSHPMRFIAFGSPAEKEMIEQEFLPQVSVPCSVAAGRTTLMQAGALLSKIDVLISNDTGPMHMAACKGVPVVALFGQLTCIVKEARPYGDNHTILVGRETKDIDVADVVRAAMVYIDAIIKKQDAIIK